MKYRVNVTANDDGSKNWFDQITNGYVRYYEVDAGSEDEAREKARALSTAEAPQYKDLSINVFWEESDNYTWRQMAYNRLSDAIDQIKCKEDLAIIPLITEAMEIAGLRECVSVKCSLKDCRAAVNKTQWEVAKAVGITESNYARLERGEADVRKMGFENAMKLCEILRITPYELMNAGDNSRKAHEKE